MKRVVHIACEHSFSDVPFPVLHAALFRWYAQHDTILTSIPTDPVPEMERVLKELQPDRILRWNGSGDPEWLQAYPTISYEFAWFPQRANCFFWPT